MLPVTVKDAQTRKLVNVDIAGFSLARVFEQFATDQMIFVTSCIIYLDRSSIPQEQRPAGHVVVIWGDFNDSHREQKCMPCGVNTEDATCYMGHGTKTIPLVHA
jgi:hypothetical protein